jgi:hypothetical protein
VKTAPGVQVADCKANEQPDFSVPGGAVELFNSRRYVGGRYETALPIDHAFNLFGMHASICSATILNRF